MKNALVATVLCAAGTVTAADYPSRAMRIIVPFSPGGATDVLARMIGRHLTEAWGQQVAVDNRAGANGVIAAELVAKSNPDGHSLLMVAIGHTTNPSLQQKLPYDTERDFQPLSLTAIFPLLLAVHPTVKAGTMQEVVKGTRSSEMRDALLKQGAEPVGNGPDEFAAFIKSEITKYARVIREAGIKAE